VGTTFPADVSLSANGAPTGSTVTITPLTIAAGAGATDVAVSVQVPGSTAAVGRRSGGWVLAFAFPLIGMFAIPRERMRKRTAQRIVLAGFLLIVALSIGGMGGCGNDSRKTPINPVQPTNYTITLTATSGGVSHSTALTLTVQ